MFNADGLECELPTSPRPAKTFATQREWGYHGTGPLQLSWDILMDLHGDEKQVAWAYRGFCARVIAGLDLNVWRLDELTVWSIYRAILAEDEADRQE